MTLLKTAEGTHAAQCDGCGRTDDPTNPGGLGIKEFAVRNPNSGGAEKHHYCTHCQTNRNGSVELLEFGWKPAEVPVAESIRDATARE